jgi:hypothetical protein
MDNDSRRVEMPLLTSGRFISIYASYFPHNIINTACNRTVSITDIRILSHEGLIGNSSHSRHKWSRMRVVLNELCFWTLSIVWCLKNKQN